MPNGRRRSVRVWGVLLVACGLVAVGCGPEASRTRGGGLGADVGNSAIPIEMHGNQARNNPSFQVPSVGRAPSDARGVPGWWAAR